METGGSGGRELHDVQQWSITPARVRRDRVVGDLERLTWSGTPEVEEEVGPLGRRQQLAVASRLQAGLRADDVRGRWGGEEFLVVLPDTDAAAAVVVAERLRPSIVAEPITLGSGSDAISVSISAGVTSSIDAIPEVLVHTADPAMYAAKAAGRDQVRFLESPII